MTHRIRVPLLASILTVALILAVTSCATFAATPTPPAQTREQDKRNNFVPPAETTFAPMANLTVETDRWAGVLGGAGYHIEVPKAGWNGKLAVYTHGYVGSESALVIRNPPIRRYLIEHGYAWAASSYSKNNFDVRAGVEDSNALALAFVSIAAANGRTLAKPARYYVFGHSMGGHIAAAAVEEENLAAERNKLRYDGALPMCGVLGDTELFEYFAAEQMAAQQLAGLPAAKFPAMEWKKIEGDVRATLFNNAKTFGTPTAQGARLKAIVMNLTGGPRPIFDEGFSHATWQNAVWDTFGTSPDVEGILAPGKNSADTRAIRYRFDAPEPVLDAFNATIARAIPDADANPPRADGLRWIPKLNGEFKVPVLSLHTLGDMYVPFSMEQIYLRRATVKGNDGHLVQRAIRGAGHCEFTVAEQVRGFEDLVNWVETGAKPAGDDVLTAATIAQPAYGCTFTDNTLGPDDSNFAKTWRAPGKLPACPVH